MEVKIHDVGRHGWKITCGGGGDDGNFGVGDFVWEVMVRRRLRVVAVLVPVPSRGHGERRHGKEAEDASS